MNAKQILFWQGVARAMCHNFWPHLTDARKARLWADMQCFIDAHKDEPVDGWQEDYCLLDSFHDYFYYDYGASINREYGDFWEIDDNPRYFYNQLRCVARASTNAVFPNDPAGVLGFTVGDMRRVFGGELPDWFLAQYERAAGEMPDDAWIRL